MLFVKRYICKDRIRPGVRYRVLVAVVCGVSKSRLSIPRGQMRVCGGAVFVIKELWALTESSNVIAHTVY